MYTFRPSNSGIFIFAFLLKWSQQLTLLHSERPKLYTILAFLSAIGLNKDSIMKGFLHPGTEIRSYKSCFLSIKMVELHGSVAIQLQLKAYANCIYPDQLAYILSGLHIHSMYFISIIFIFWANSRSPNQISWLVEFNGFLRQYFSLYQAVSQRGRKKRESVDKRKNVQATPTHTYCKHNRPLLYYYPT